MKKLIALCAVLGFTAQANAQVEMSHSGGFRLQYMANDNAGFAETGTSHDWAQRFQWNMGIKAGENMNVHAKLVHAASWGGNADQYPGDGSIATGNTVNAQKDTLTVNELKAIWTVSDESTVAYGRGTYTMADGTVVASNEWEQVQKAFDGGMFSYDHEMAKFNLFAVRGANGTAARVYGDFMGLSVDFKALPEFLKMANLHYISVKRDSGAYLVNGVSANLGEEDTSRMGLTVGGDTAGVDYRATYAMYSGETIAFGSTTANDVDASMMDAEVGYSMPDTMNLRVSVLYHTDSGETTGADTTRYSGFHYDTHNNAGLMDVLAWGNLTYTKLAVTLDPAEDISVGLAYYQFTATEENDTVNSSTGAVASVAAQDDVGTEMDFWVTKRYTSNFSITGWYGQFAGGDKVGTSPEDMTQVYLSGNYTF